MTVNEAIHARRSIRNYSDKQVPRELVLDVLEAARQAPSGNNKQPWKFIVVEDAEQRKELARISHNQTWMATAPVFIVACADLGTLEEKPGRFDEDSPGMNAKRCVRDTASAVDNMMLQAVELGLGTCWIGWYLQKDIKSALAIPDPVFVLGILPLGYPAEAPDARPRKPLEEIVYGESWGMQYFTEPSEI